MQLLRAVRNMQKTYLHAIAADASRRVWKPKIRNAAACAAAACNTNLLKPSINAPAAAQQCTSTARNASPAKQHLPEAQELQPFFSALKLEISPLPHPTIAMKATRPCRVAKQGSPEKVMRPRNVPAQHFHTLGHQDQKPTILLKVRKNRFTIEIPCLKSSSVEPQLDKEGRTTRNGRGNDRRKQSTGGRGNQANSQHEETNINRIELRTTTIFLTCEIRLNFSHLQPNDDSQIYPSPQLMRVIINHELEPKWLRSVVVVSDACLDVRCVCPQRGFATAVISAVLVIPPARPRKSSFHRETLRILILSTHCSSQIQEAELQQ